MYLCVEETQGFILLPLCHVFYVLVNWHDIGNLYRIGNATRKFSPEYSCNKDSKRWQKYNSMTYFRSLSFETRSHDCQPIYCVQWRDCHSPRSNVLNSLFIYEFDTNVLFCWKHLINKRPMGHTAQLRTSSNQ